MLSLKGDLTCLWLQLHNCSKVIVSVRIVYNLSLLVEYVLILSLKIWDILRKAKHFTEKPHNALHEESLF